MHCHKDTKTQSFTKVDALRPLLINFLCGTLREMHSEAHTRTCVTQSKIVNLKSKII